MDKTILPQKIFWTPASCMKLYIELYEKILISEKEDSERWKISTRVIRLIVLISTASILMNMAIFYNAMGLVLKSSLVVITTVSKKEFLGYESERYTEDFNKHLAYSIKDLFYQFFKPSLCIIYTLDPELLKIIDNLADRFIEQIGL
jgi:hypothetical protein